MPREPRFYDRIELRSNLTRNVIHHLLSPITVYAQCESPAFLRQALKSAVGENHLPSKEEINKGAQHRRSTDNLTAIKSEEHWKRTAVVASSHMRNARLLLEQADLVGDSVKPILYYYGGLSFLNFITSCVVGRKRVGHPGHGLSVSCSDEGWNFDRHWAREKCLIEVKSSGDFPFFVDALTAAGWPSLFSEYRIQADTEANPGEIIENPAPLLKGQKASLDRLCNFDLYRFWEDNPAARKWAIGANKWKVIWDFTTLLLDFIVAYVASSLARYYIPAWRNITVGEKSPIYNDIKFGHGLSQIDTFSKAI